MTVEPARCTLLALDAVERGLHAKRRVARRLVRQPRETVSWRAVVELAAQRIVERAPELVADATSRRCRELRGAHSSRRVGEGPRAEAPHHDDRARRGGLEQLQQGVITALLWLIEAPAPMRVLTDSNDARAWVRERIASESTAGR